MIPAAHLTSEYHGARMQWWLAKLASTPRRCLWRRHCARVRANLHAEIMLAAQQIEAYERKHPESATPFGNPPLEDM